MRKIKINLTQNALRKFAKEWILPLVIGLILATSVRTYALTRVDVNGPSMEKTLANRDVMFEEKISIYMNNIKQGDIITFKSHDKEMPSYIKRVIAVAGETIMIDNGEVYLNGKQLSEKYLASGTETYGDNFLKAGQKYTVPKGCVFVMGDNRMVSSDSRYFGPVKLSDVQGKVFIRVFPFKSFKTF